MKAIIMAGGQGSRLLPLTEDIPKPLAPIVNKPCIIHIVELLRRHNITEMAATVMYKKEMLEDVLIREGVAVVEEKKPLGTAGSVKGCEEFLDGDFMVISGDCICDFDLTKAIEFHYSHGGIATLVLSEVKNPLEYGVCVTDDENIITRFIEKPSWERAYSGTVNTGIYIFSREVLNYIEKDKNSDFSKDIFPMLMKNKEKLHGYKAQGYWCDIGNTSAYLRCNKDILASKAKISYTSRKKIKGLQIIEPCCIGENVVAEGSVVGPYSIIGNGVRLCKNSHVSKSVIADNVTIGENAYVKNAVVGKGCMLGNDATVGDYSVIGSFCVVGNDCVVAAESKVYAKNILPVGAIIHGKVMHADGKMEIFDRSQTGEALARLGASIGITFKDNVAIARESRDETAKAFSLIGGIMSGGANVMNFDECDKNMFRFVMREYGFTAGVYIGCDCLCFYEQDGLKLSYDSLKKLEKNLDSELPENEGRYRTLRDYSKLYEGKLKKYLMNMKTVPFYVYAPEFFTSLISVRPSDESERIYIGDELGVDEYAPEIVTCAAVYAYGKTYGRVYIPYSYPGVLEKLGNNSEFEVCRLTYEDSERRRLYDLSDPNVAGAVLLRYLTKNHMSFKTLTEILPPLSVVSKDFDCSEDKCEVMKKLLSIPAKERELIEGIRFMDEKADVRIIPKSDLHSFKIVVGAESSEMATEICDFYVKKIKRIEKDTF